MTRKHHPKKPLLVSTKLFLVPLFLLTVVFASRAQNCNVDFPGSANVVFSTACGSSPNNVVLGNTSKFGDGDVLTFDASVTISGNLTVRADGSGKIVIPAGVSVDITGNVDLQNSGGCTSASPCTFEIVVTGTLHISGNFQSSLMTVVWSGTGTVIFDDKFDNKGNGCMQCGTGGCPNFQVDAADCKDQGSGCTQGDFCAAIAACANDITLPTISGCPPSMSFVLTGTGCTQSVNWTLPTAKDNCTLASFTSTHNPGFAFPEGITTVTYTATDLKGNKAICSFTVTIVDQTAPVFSNCPAKIRVAARPATCDAVVNWTLPVATDNCGSVTLTSTHTPGSIFPIGTTAINYTATDVAGNSASCDFNVVVTNETVPVISGCPGNIAVRADESGEIAVTWIEPTATVACGSVVLDATHRPGDVFPVGETEVTYTANTLHGKTTTCKFKVVVSVDIEFTISPLITPNGDGTNDYWELTNIEKFGTNHVVIVDRWGSVIFKASGYNNGSVAWRGENRQGKPVPTGTYFYRISVDFLSEHIEKRGSVEVVR